MTLTRRQEQDAVTEGTRIDVSVHEGLELYDRPMIMGEASLWLLVACEWLR